ncbi:fungal specific transcription factor domain-containing protein [Aspergillus tanneri]|uniref:Transcription factor domain-containing protein n=1 Tax=Aspergillus tanneri TaxID=1220188 RepID=A0A5M9MYP1_9EURO|nr:uncharacterized protein ATNIH1004_001165 [Aspergillus tanneri]KAA8652261.1 hypothetical protein ATNIH1004_001165 [Aspergillus tanneri]
MTIVSLVKPTRRGSSLRKRSLWLPIIAPKEDATNSGLNLPVATRTKTTRSRVRFPPRSRTGCWYVFLPQDAAIQCTRLGHTCDYRPRLCFRDDTRRIMERMSDVIITGNMIWDRGWSSDVSKTPKSPITNLCHNLPSFVMLTSDEDREKKAEASIPGTYHVIVIPESFAHLPEYTECTPEKDGRDLVASPLLITSGGDQDRDGLLEDDPNVVILKGFGDSRRYSINRKSTGPSLKADLQSPSIDVPSAPPTIAHGNSREHMPELVGHDNILLEHFRDVVVVQLIPEMSMGGCPNGSSMLSSEIFEQKAARLPRLYHAILALSALSLSRQGSGLNMDALQYYHRALASLEEEVPGDEDLLSDGVLLTHFLLLVYEISAAQLDDSNLRPYHTSQLLHIAHRRQSAYGAERYPFLLWWVCYIDLYALLRGVGTGEFVKAAIESRWLPSVESLLAPDGLETSSPVHPEERSNLLLLLERLHHDTLALALRIGLLVLEARKSLLSYPGTQVGMWQNAEELREELQRLWGSPEAHFLIQNQSVLPKRPRNLLQQSQVLFHTTLLLSYISLWPGQRTGRETSSTDGDGEAQYQASVILHLAEDMILPAHESGRHVIIFPIFLAGTVARSSGLKIRAWELLSSLEEEEMGYHASSTCHQLQLVYEQQMQQTWDGSETPWIDCVELLGERGSHCSLA